MDHLGAPQALTDANKTIVWDGSFTPFGEAETLLEKIGLRSGLRNGWCRNVALINRPLRKTGSHRCAGKWRIARAIKI